MIQVNLIIKQSRWINRIVKQAKPVFRWAVLPCLIILLNACIPQSDPIIQPEPTDSKPTAIFNPIATPPSNQPDLKTNPTYVPADLPETAIPKASTPLVSYQPISPLADISIPQLDEILSNPFITPSPGQDDGHHGSDFSFYRFNDRISIINMEIQSIFPGTTSAVIQNRPPYGNAIIIETPLNQLTSTLQSLAESYEIPAQVEYQSLIHCPIIPQINPEELGPEVSLYVMYAHMVDTPDFEVGDTIFQGQIIGLVGNSGMSGNPHLHLETRFGPTRATFPVMAHYDNGVSVDEMGYYCFWRTSGFFELLNPMLFFE